MITVRTKYFCGIHAGLIVTATKCRVERQNKLENWQKCQWLSPRAPTSSRDGGEPPTPRNPTAIDATPQALGANSACLCRSEPGVYIANTGQLYTAVGKQGSCSAKIYSKLSRTGSYADRSSFLGFSRT